LDLTRYPAANSVNRANGMRVSWNHAVDVVAEISGNLIVLIPLQIVVNIRSFRQG